MTEPWAVQKAQGKARALLRELNDAMKTPRGDYYQGDIADPHRILHIIERHLADALAEAVAERYKEALEDIALGRWNVDRMGRDIDVRTFARQALAEPTP